VVPAEPLHGCLPIKPPPAYVSLPPTYFWIAIIERSVPGSHNECTFQVLRLRASGKEHVVILRNAHHER
jgi:hypothetical protein